MLQLMNLPDEVHFAIQSHMTLPTLLTARAVCRFWHSLIPGAHIPSARLSLLRLYLQAVHSPAFQVTRKHVVSRLQSFDRERALRMVAKDGTGDDIPEEFKLWILEWPERAAFPGVWPGLREDAGKAASCEEESLYKDHGTSLLNADRPYILNQLEVPKGEGDDKSEMQVVPTWISVHPSQRALALLLDDAYVNGWQRSRMLVLSAPTSSLEMAGKVYQVDGVRAKVDEPFASSWVDYLHHELAREDRWIQEHPQADVGV